MPETVRRSSRSLPGPRGSGITTQPSSPTVLTSASTGSRERSRSSSSSARQRRHLARPRPVRRARGFPCRRLVDRRHAEEQLREGAAAAEALVLASRDRLGVAVDRVGRELVDVGEDRLREEAQRRRVEPRCLRRVRRQRPARRRGTRSSRASGPGGARRRPARDRPRGPACDRRRDRGSGRRTGRAPRSRLRRPRPKLPSSGAHTREPRARSRRGCPGWLPRARARSPSRPKPEGRATAPPRASLADK